MKARCEYCNNLVDDGEEICPGCGAVNKNYKRVANEVPTTIDELKQWYKDRNLPPYETTRFFIDIDYKAPKAFGIYKDNATGKYVVYKNKDTGERAIRYEGTDEKYAVNELYLKLKEEIAMRKNGRVSNNTEKIVLIFDIAWGLLFLFSMIMLIFMPGDGYYTINGNNYYNHSGDWYIYENNDWSSTSTPSYDGSLRDYYNGSGYVGGEDYSDIKDSSVYDSSWESSSWDSDSDWDSDSSWDSGGSDWSSDW